ncbi:MAG TPA: GntR family transcriptional regulator [Peptococcaceae bacterium]|nr:GntR family transcriptional regulator [Peptococcaceae bacterium]
MEHLSLKESAYKIIKEKLLNLEFEPGSRLREDLLAQEISMSRTPVREAINQLSAEGLVNNIPRRGIFVIQLTPQEISDFLDIREALEALAIEKCISNITERELKALEKIQMDFKSALAENNFKKCNSLDSKFHQEIAQISNNKKLIEFLGEIEDFMRIARAMEKKEQPKMKNELTFKEHQAILEAIRDKDVKRAREAISVNIRTMKANLGLA